MTDGILIDLSDILVSADAPLRADTFPHLAAALDRIVQAAQEQWVSYAHGAPLPDGATIHNRTGEYARSILTCQLGDFSGEVYSDLPYAQAIEEGSPARDMKKILGSSLKVRLTKDGRRYLIIPFRHNSPDSVLGNNMPQAVADWWKQGRIASAITGTYQRPSGTRAFDIRTRKRIVVPGWRYKWGDRLHEADLAGMPGVGAKQAKRLVGMINFRNPRSAAGGGAAAGPHSQFVSFRTMLEGGKGWIAPAQPGKFPAKTTADTLRPIAEEAFKTAVQEDIKTIFAGTEE